MQRPSVGAPGAPGGGAPGAPPSTGHLSGGEHEVDNRSRNARAQRRHREKRKAHFKALEESVQILTQQLEEARRQLGAATYANSARFAYSPESKDIASLTAENAYLRDENADLRRQLYTLRVSHGGGSSGRDMGTLPPTGDTKVTTGIWPEAKTESAAYSSGGGVYSAPNSAVLSSPRVGPSSSHGRTMSHPGDFVRDPAAEGSSSSTSSYPPPLGYQISGGVVEGSSSDKWSTGGETSTRHGQQRGSSSSSRGRMPSAGPSQSPYATAAHFPTNPRAHSLNTPTQQPYMVRYESQVYPPTIPAHNMPRSAAMSSSGQGSGGGYTHATTPVQQYVPRAEGEVAWQDPQQQPPVLSYQPATH